MIEVAHRNSSLMSPQSSGSCMSGVKCHSSAAVRALVAALSIIGTGIDALPSPMFACAAFCGAPGEGPYTPSREDERDEAPDDDACDLEWPLLSLITRNGQSDASARLAQLLRPATREWSSLAHDETPPRQPHAPRARLVPLPIALCRLTC